MLSEEASGFAQPERWSGQGCSTEVIGDGGSSKQRPAEQGERAKSYKLGWGSQDLAERGSTPFPPAKVGALGDPGDQHMKAEIKELCKNQTLCKTLPGWTTKYVKGLRVWAQSLQLESSIRIKGERKPESARNEISSLISCSGSSFGVYTFNS